ncbi:hypothetical protein [Gracilimonas sp.]
MLCHESYRKESASTPVMARIRKLDETIEEKVQAVISEFEKVYQD